MSEQPRFVERLRHALITFKHGGPVCVHTEENCVYCQRNRITDTAVSLKLKLQDARMGR